MGHSNARLIFPGFAAKQNIISEDDFNMFALSDTRLSNEIPSDYIKIQGYNFFCTNRESRLEAVGAFAISLFHSEILEFDVGSNIG